MVVQFRNDGEHPTGAAIAAIVFDAISSLLITVFVIIRVWSRYSSADNAASVLSKLSVGGVEDAEEDEEGRVVVVVEGQWGGDVLEEERS